MITLFIDTCTSVLTIALIKDNTLLYNSSLSSNEHSKYAMIEIEKALNIANITSKEVNKIVVTNGPGSFTGIRIGVTIAKTFAWCEKINVCALSTLKAFAISSNYDGYCVPLIDARRNYVFSGIYNDKYTEVFDDSYIKLDEIIEKSNKFTNILFVTNDCLDLYSKYNLNIQSVVIDPLKICNYLQNDIGISPIEVLPIYLKKTEAEERLELRND